jgi:two-component system, response regulator PdtaR
MSEKINILIIEDEEILAWDLREKLRKEGYHVVENVSSGAEALEVFQQNEIDLILCDINIDGEWDGIETMNNILKIKQVPIIYLTALSDKETIERAKHTQPAAYVTKPFQLQNLRIAIDLAIHSEEKEYNRETILQIDDYIFIKQNYQFVKTHLNTILYLEADGNYTHLVTTEKKYTLYMSISSMLERLNFDKLVRVHRSFALNMDKIDTFNDQEVFVGTHILPLSRSYKEEFMKMFRFK